jgi:hypothetical protein
MKKLLVMAAVTVAATTAFAGAKLVVRSDYVNTPVYDDAAGAEVNGKSLFLPAVARLYLTGNVGDAIIDTGWNLRAFTPEFGASTPAGADVNLYKNVTVDSLVDHLFIAKPMNEWTFTAGKLWTNVGGFERRATWDGDTYLTSAANGGVGGKTATAGLFGATGSVVTPQNMSGVAASYKFSENHKVEVQALNQTNSTTVTNGVASNDRRHSLGGAYWGSFADNMVKAYLSYTSGAADTSAAGHEQEFIGAGFRFAPMEHLGVDLEYLANSDKTSTTGAKDETNSTIVEVRYAMNGWTPILKYEMSNIKVADTDVFKRNAFAVAVEYAPKPEDAFRYHVAYTQASDDYDAADKVDFSTITVGIKYAGDIAK